MYVFIIMTRRPRVFTKVEGKKIIFLHFGCVSAVSKKSASCFFAIALDLHYLCKLKGEVDA